MIELIKEKLKAFFAWVYNWITVITGIVVGFLTSLPDLVMSLAGVDFSPILGPSRAAQIVTVVAVVKAIVAFYQSRKAA